MAENKLQAVLSPLNAWSYAFGCLLGWGAFTMPLTVFLPRSGLRGSLLGFAAGALCVALIALNYYYLSKQCTGNGGIFYLLFNTWGRPHAYAAAWMISFAHLLIIPLNVRAVALLIHVLLREYAGITIDWQLGLTAQIFDLVIIVAVLAPFGWINSRGIRLSARIQTVLAVMLFAGIAILLLMALFSGVDISAKMSPANLPGANPFRSFMLMFILIPWAFVGFDSVPALSREARFSKNKLGVIMILAIAAGAFCYMANIIVTVLGAPISWIHEAGRAGEGLESISVVASIRRMYGGFGTAVALITLLAGILTGINGSIANVSRLYYTMGRSKCLFHGFGKTNKWGAPSAAITFSVFAAIFLVMISDTFNTMETVAAVCTAFGFGYCSLRALICAEKNGDRRYMLTGAIGWLVCVAWFILLLLPTLGTDEAADWRVYMSLAGWILVGIVGYAMTSRTSVASLDT